MRVHLIFRLTLAVVLAAPTLPALAQATPAAGADGGIPISVGGGFSTWNVNWGSGRMEGGTVWLDWNLPTTTPALRGFTVEGEFRDISIGGSVTQPNLRQDTGAGGMLYAWPHYKNVRPYAKLLFGVASEDFITSDPSYSHDTRGFVAPGGGVEFKAVGPIWVRADYECQFWQNLISGTPEPNGFTFGILYDFKGGHRH